MPQKRLYIPLTTAEFTRLRELAWAERRSPRDHAALLLTHALGFESGDAPATDRARPSAPPRASTDVLTDATVVGGTSA